MCVCVCLCACLIKLILCGTIIIRSNTIVINNIELKVVLLVLTGEAMYRPADSIPRRIKLTSLAYRLAINKVSFKHISCLRKDSKLLHIQ